MSNSNLITSNEYGIYYLDKNGVLNEVKHSYIIYTKYYNVSSGGITYEIFDKIPNCLEICSMYGKDIILLLRDGTILYRYTEKSKYIIPSDIIPTLTNIERIACYANTYFLLDAISNLHVIHFNGTVRYNKYSNIKDFRGSENAYMLLTYDDTCTIYAPTLIDLPGTYQTIECGYQTLICLSNHNKLTFYTFHDNYESACHTVDNVLEVNFSYAITGNNLYILTNDYTLTIYEYEYDNYENEIFVAPREIVSIQIPLDLTFSENYVVNLDSGMVYMSKSFKLYINNLKNYKTPEDTPYINPNNIKRLINFGMYLIVENINDEYIGYVYSGIASGFQNLSNITLLEKTIGSYI